MEPHIEIRNGQFWYGKNKTNEKSYRVVCGILDDEKIGHKIYLLAADESGKMLTRNRMDRLMSNPDFYSATIRSIGETVKEVVIE